MKAQTIEFNTGFAFSKIEKGFFECLRDNLEGIEGDFYIPKCWFGLRPVKSSCDISELSVQLKYNLYNVFSQIAPKHDLTLEICTELQYIKFKYSIKKKLDVKKMTVSEIEKALGYKIQIVSEE